MTTLARALRASLWIPLLLAAGSAQARGFQIAPFAGYQFGGSVRSAEFGQQYSFDDGLAWGGTASFALDKRWRVELLYSRQESGLSPPGAAGPSFDLTTERLMAGIQEEKGAGRTRYFGSFMLGATRFTPALSGRGSETRFAASVGLGLKRFVSERFAVRFDARAFYTVVQAGGGVFCSGGCLFVFSGSGIWQGDFSGGIVLAF